MFKSIFYLGLFIFCIVSLQIINVYGEDIKECEVCVKVINDLKTQYTNTIKENKRDKLTIAENTITKYCGKKHNPKDNKLCYNLEPLKKDVARQLTFGKDAMKICKTLEKKNPDFCSMRYPMKTDENTDYSKLRVKQLKQILHERGLECIGCVEKQDFIKKLKDTTGHSELKITH